MKCPICKSELRKAKASARPGIHMYIWYVCDKCKKLFGEKDL